MKQFGNESGIWIITLLLTVVTISGALCAEPVATYKGGVVTAEELGYYESLQKMQTRRYDAQLAAPAMLNDIVAERLLAEKARALKLDREKEFQEEAKKIEDDSLSMSLQAQFYVPVTVSEKEIEEEYQKKSFDYRKDPTRKVRYIFVEFGQNPTAEKKAEARKKANELRVRAQRGEDFAELARKYSDANSAAQGGDIGYIGRGKLQAAFEQAVWSLALWEISEPVLTKYGYCVIRVEDEKGPSVTPLEELKESIRSSLMAKKRRDAVFYFRSDVSREGLFRQHLEPLQKDNPSSSDVLVTIGDFKYTYADFKKRLERESLDIAKMSNVDREEWLNRVIEEFYFPKVALAKGIQNTPRYKAFVEFQGNAKLANRYVEKKLEEAKPSDRELRRFYESNLKMFERLIRRQLKAILVKADVPEKANQAQRHYAFEAAKKKIDAVAEKLKKGESFEALADRYDETPNHKSGGDIGWVQEPTTPYVDLTVRKMAEGDVSDPVEFSQGYVMIKVVKIEMPKFDEVRDEVLKYWETAKRRELTAQLRQEALREAKFQINPKALAAYTEAHKN
jgi:parvulin-like peptidyl-prolyl isomerase